MSNALLKVEGLKQHFPVSRKFSVKAVNGVSFEIFPRRNLWSGGRIRLR